MSSVFETGWLDLLNIVTLWKQVGVKVHIKLQTVAP